VLALLLMQALLPQSAIAQAAPLDSEGPSSEWRLRGRWEVHANADDIRALARDGDSLWATSVGGGVMRWTVDGQLEAQYLAPRDGLPCNDVRDVLLWRGTWFFATCDGLAAWQPASGRMATVTVALPSPSLTALAVDAQDRLWVASEPVWDNALRLPGREVPGGWHGGGLAVTEDGEHFVSYGLADGLPSLDIRDVTMWRDQMWVATRPYQRWREPGQDPDGNPVPGAWEPSGGGVARLDGLRWLPMGADQSSELSDDARMLAAGEDVLWLATGGRGLAAWNGASWFGLRDCGNESRCIQDDYVTAVAVGPDGAVWVATERFNGQGTGVAVLDPRGTPTNADDDAWFVLRGESAPPGDLVHAILPDADATVWFGAAARDPQGLLHGRGLARLLGDRQSLVVRRHADQGGAPPGNDLTAVLPDAATGTLWVGTARDGLGERLPDGTWRHYNRASTDGLLGSDSIADLALGPDGALWVATRQITYDAKANRWVDGGLSRYHDGRWQRFTTEDGLPSDHLSALALDPNGTLWVGTGATDRGPKEHAYRGMGLAALDAVTGRWARTYTHPDLRSNNVTDLAVQDGKLFVATAYFFFVDPRPGGVRMTTGGGLSVLDIASGTWRGFDAESGLSPALRGRDGRPLLDLRAVLPVDGGGAWVGGLAYPDGRFDPEVEPGGVIEAVEIADEVGSGLALRGTGAITALATDPDGLLWAGTAGDGARVRVPDGSWLRVAPAGGALARRGVGALGRDGDGLWLGTRGGGLAVLRPPAVTPEPGPPEPSPTPGAVEGTPGPADPISVGLIWRPGRQIYLPTVKREFVPMLVSGGGGGG
jgi:ligand-binding sensor domain-containing protein